MSLQSKLFRGDPKLEAAAVSDPAHVVPGASGEHVRKIQLALIRLDGAAIEPDGQYGPATAAAVLAFKQKRGVINRARQTQADNIVGQMTMAALDRELLAKELIPADPIRIKPVNPRPRGSRPALRLGFKIDVDFPVFPTGIPTTIRLTPRSTADLEIVNGKSGRVRCTNATKGEGKTSLIFDPDEPSFIPATRLVPGPQGPLGREPLQDGGTIRITKDPFNIKLDAFHPGNAVVDASDGTSTNQLLIEVRAPRLANVPGFSPPTKTRPGSKFISANDSEPGPKMFGTSTGGRPVNPKGTGRKINIFGSQETPGFEDFTSTLPFSGFNPGEFRLVSDASTIFRPWTEDTDPSVGVGTGQASDICLRNSPAFPDTIKAIRRIASSVCRLTFTSTSEGAKRFIPILKTEFPGFKVIEEFDDAIVMELP